MSVPSRLLEFIRARGLIQPGDHVLVAVSGGVDSVALLHLLRSLSEALPCTLGAAHFDHAMRGDSAADAQWVADLCATWDVPLVQARTTRTLRTESDARTERYRFLYQAMRATRARRVATAHHADDQIETVLFRLLRGSGLRGLSGIPLRRGPFIRPLLRCYKKDLLAYAEANGIEYRRDPTNDELTFMRNRIRQTLVPALAQVQPSAKRAVLALARHAAKTEAAWHSALVRLEKELVISDEIARVELARDLLQEYHPALRARLMRHFLRRFGATPSRASTRHILQFCSNAESGSVLEVAGRARIERSFDRLRMERMKPRSDADAGAFIETTAGQARARIGNRNYTIEWSLAALAGELSEQFDAAILQHRLEVRGWRSGDRIELPYGTKKLKKLFVERRIAVSDRRQLPLLVDDRGRVLWVPGVARSVHAVPSDTGQILTIVVKHAELG